MSNFTYSQCGSIIYDVLLSVSESVIFVYIYFRSSQNTRS